MAVRRLADEQPEGFAFTPENLEWAKRKIAEYPEGRQHSAIIPLLWRAQEQNERWLPEPAIRYVADMLDMPYIRALEVATFYTMFQLQPVGRIAHLQVCGTTPCMLRGAEDLIAICRKRIARDAFALSEDGAFSWEEVECAGACVNAPMVQIGADTYEDLTPETFEALLDGLAAGKPPKPGPQNGRRASEPLGGPTTLVPPEARRKKPGAPAKVTASAGSGSAGGAKAGIAAGPDTATAAPNAVADKVPPAGTHPATPHAQGENAAHPDPSFERAEVAASRSNGSDRRDASPAAPPPGSSGTPETVPSPPPKQKDAQRGAVAEASARAGAEGAAVAEEEIGERPPGDPEVSGGRDDLKRISGIGPKTEETLHGLGVFRFEQIAAWSEANVAWVDHHLAFKGRVVRERWVEQARELAGSDGSGTDKA